MIKRGFALCLLAGLYAICTMAQMDKDGWKLVWNDEFDVDGRPDAQKWDYERGFVRNYELQWYAPENAFQRDGKLVIEARPADFPCPAYREGNKNWRNSREKVEWTSAALITKGKYTFQYGRLEVRARIPVCKGAWPAIWLLGTLHSWPANGEIDVLEYYQHKGVPTILANACWAGDTTDDAEWDSSYTPLTHFTERDPAWAERFHVWHMDWDKDFIRLYLDDELLNEIDLKRTINGKAGGTGINPFHYQQYLLLNLALDTRVKELNPADFPIKYEIDYVRVFQK
ncbi:MAG: glycoside hydrolase family 16 protein [Bacteroidaceae bacterium]|nr:glycoside hydrolase family 16 protein [Bacteroidaceae bacterium]